jgi:DNA polymerase III subunit delta
MTNKKIYYVYGDEDFLVTEQVAKIRSGFPEESIDHYQGKVDISNLFEAIATGGLFVQTKLILFKNPWFLFDAISDDEVKELQQLIKQANDGDNTLVIYILDKKVDQRKKLAAFLKKNAELTEHKAFKDWEQDKLMSWISNKIKNLKKTIDRNTLIMFAQVEGTNLRHIAGEIEKLCVYIGDRQEITLKDIKAISVGANSSIYPLNEAMKEKKMSSIMPFFYKLLQNGEHPIRILALVLTNIRFYYQIIALKEQGKNTQEMGKLIGKNPYFISMTQQVICKHYSKEVLEKAFHKLSKTDLMIKTGKIDPKVGLELALIDIFK